MVASRKNKLLVLIMACAFVVPAWGQPEVPWMWPEDHERMVNYASMFEGTPYSFGARKPSSEDCSSLVQKIFSLMGVELPRSSREQAHDMRFVEVPKETLRSGDLIFFKNTYRRGISHVGFMVDAETMIHASPRDRQVARHGFSPRHPLWRKIHSVRRWKNTIEGDYLRPQFSWDDKI